MRKDINWTPDYEPEVGDQVTLFDGVTYTSGNWTNSIFKAYARAIGKVSRLVPDPVPPEGYRRCELEGNEANPNLMAFNTIYPSLGWFPCVPDKRSHLIWAVPLASAETLAPPAPPPLRRNLSDPDSRKFWEFVDSVVAPAEKENSAEGIECVVFDHAGFGYLVSPVNPTQKAFNVGDRVRVVPVEGR